MLHRLHMSRKRRNNGRELSREYCQLSGGIHAYDVAVAAGKHRQTVDGRSLHHR